MAMPGFTILILSLVVFVAPHEIYIRENPNAFVTIRVSSFFTLY